MHSDYHPRPVPTCFGCKVASVGYQGLKSAAGGRNSDPVQETAVVGEEGPRRGQVIGRQDVHWDGRRDARVHAPSLHVKTTTTESA